MNIFELISLVGINFGSYFFILYIVLFSILVVIKCKEKTTFKEAMGKQWCDAFFIYFPLAIFALLGVGVGTNIAMDLSILSCKGFWNKLFATHVVLSVLIFFIVYYQSKEIKKEQ